MARMAPYSRPSTGPPAKWCVLAGGRALPDSCCARRRPHACGTQYRRGCDRSLALATRRSRSSLGRSVPRLSTAHASLRFKRAAHADSLHTPPRPCTPLSVGGREEDEEEVLHVGRMHAAPRSAGAKRCCSPASRSRDVSHAHRPPAARAHTRTLAQLPARAAACSR